MNRANPTDTTPASNPTVLYGVKEAASLAGLGAGVLRHHLKVGHVAPDFVCGKQVFFLSTRAEGLAIELRTYLSHKKGVVG